MRCPNVCGIITKFDVPEAPDGRRRVLGVLAYLDPR
jgi:hypothetical protein